VQDGLGQGLQVHVLLGAEVLDDQGLADAGVLRVASVVMAR